MEGQRRARASLAEERERHATAPIRYVADLLCTDMDNERAIHWLLANVTPFYG
jgi:hypothetical protein